MPGVPMSAALSGLACKLTHGPSGATLTTIPPRDNGGDGSSFSPTDMVGAALMACALSTMALVAQREGLSWGDAGAYGGEDHVSPAPAHRGTHAGVRHAARGAPRAPGATRGGGR